MARPEDTYEDAAEPPAARDNHETRVVGAGRSVERASSPSPDVNPAAGALESSAERYLARRQLGLGSMGEVHLCKDTRIGRDVAKKVLLPNHRHDATLRARFLRESRIQGQLEHPSIVPVYDLGVDEEGATYFTMKRLRGSTLKQVLRGLRDGDAEIAGKFSQRRLLTAFSSVCLTVGFAHSRGVLHRDLKPSNVMLGNFGEVYVLDWGIAKLKKEVAAAAAAVAAEKKGHAPILDEDTTQHRPVDASDDVHTAAGKILGTFGYMAPEQARGAITELDARSDVYSLGAILFEILTLEPLHPKTSWKEMLFSTLKGVSARPSRRTPHLDVPPELEEICVKATRTDPKNRYPSARDLHEAVERYLDGDRDLEARLTMARAHAGKAEERAAEALAGAGNREAEHARREALREVGRALALDPSNGAAVQVLTKLWTLPPAELPGEVVKDIRVSRSKRARLLIRQSIVFDLACAVLLVLSALWMRLLSAPLLAAAVSLTLVSACFKELSGRDHQVTRGHLFAYGAFVLNILSLLCLSRSFGPLFFTPALLSLFTLGYSSSPIARYRVTVLVTGCVALLGSVAVEVLGAQVHEVGARIPPSYAFPSDHLSMTILAHGVELPYGPTLVALTVGSLLLILAPGLMMGQQQDALRDVERRSALQTWHLKHLLPDEAQQPVRRAGS